MKLIRNIKTLAKRLKSGFEASRSISKSGLTDEELEDSLDLQDALEALEEIRTEGTVSWDSLKSELNLWTPELSLQEEQQKL